MGPSKSTSISVKHNGTTNTSTFLQGLFPMYLHKVVITILCLQLSLTVYIHKDISYHLYKGISTIVHLLLSLPVSLRKGILQPSLFTSLWSKKSSLLASLRNGRLRSSLLMSILSLLVSLRNGALQLSLLVFLWNNFVRTYPLISLWKLFLRHLYKGIYTITPIQVKPEPSKSLRCLYKYISTVAHTQVKSETTILWVPSHSSLQPYVKYFYKLITYYMIDYNHSINTGNIKR